MPNFRIAHQPPAMLKLPGLEYDNAVMGRFHLMRRMYAFALGMTIVASAVAIAQSRISDQPKAIDKPLAYDVVSIKPSHADAYESWSRMTADTLSMDVTLKSLIITAYSLQSDDLISGLPGWAATAQFDVEAKMDADTAASLAKFPQREQNIRTCGVFSYSAKTAEWPIAWRSHLTFLDSKRRLPTRTSRRWISLRRNPSRLL